MSNQLIPPIKAAIFKAVLNIDIDHLLTLDSKDLYPVLPYLIRLALHSSAKQSCLDEGFLARRKKLMKLLHPIDRANAIVPLLTLDFQKLDTDARLEQQTRHNYKHLIHQNVTPKLPHMKSILLPKNINPSDSNALTMEFERCEGLGQLSVILVEYMNICDHLRHIKEAPASNNTAATIANRAHGPQQAHVQQQQQQQESKFKSELFDNPIYFNDVALCLSVLLAELPPTTLNILDMSEMLLYVKNGPHFITRLVANMPDMFHEVCSSLINNGDKQDEDIVLSDLKDLRTNALKLLCEMNPSQALAVRSEAIQASKLPSLTVIITLDAFVKAISKYKGCNTPQNKSAQSNSKTQLDDYYDGVIAFVSGTLLGADDKTRSWFSQYMKLGQKRIDQGHPSVLSSLRSQVLWYMQDVLLPFMSKLEPGTSDKPIKSSIINSQIIRACATLRMYCALRCIGMIKLNDQESSTLVRLITCRTKVSPASVHFATIGFCTILASSSILTNQDAEKRVTDWLKWLITKYHKSSLAELVLLVAIHFHNNQMGQIADLICATLGMNIQIKTSIAKCKSSFVQDVFTDQMVTEHSVKVPVTKNLNNNIPGFLPVHCIHQLLESRAFSKHQVPIKDWIFKQICQSTAPVHSIFPQLIGAFVNSIISSYPCTNEPISWQEMEPIFRIKVYSSEDENKDISCVLTSQILLLYYLLLYEDVRLKKNLENLQMGRNNILKYKQEFMAGIPIFYLMQQVHDNQQKYGSILAHLLKLVTTHFPQLCLVQHWLTSDTITAPVQLNYSRKESLNSDELIAKLQDAFQSLSDDQTKLIKIINQLLALPVEKLWPLSSVFVSNMPKLLLDDFHINNSTLKVSGALWWKLNLIFPRKLWLMTVNALQLRSKNTNYKEYDWNDIVNDPLCVLRCNPKVFRAGPILEIILHMLSAFLAASRRHLYDHLREQPSDQNDEQRNREELRVALVAAQESAALQILLECCLPQSEQEEILFDELFANAQKPETSSAQCDNEKICSNSIAHKCYKDSVIIICNHLHQVFISDTNLARLVHFQTYSGDLLSITTTHIPSMHICLDFVPDMMAQPDLKKQVFVIELVSHLCDKYAITKSLNAAKLCFNVSITLLQLLPSRRRAIYFIPVLPALIRMSKIFPILKEDLAIILTQLNHITMAHLASTSSRLSLGSSTTPFEGLKDMSWRDTKKLMSTMGLQEALYLTIQYCNIELNRSNSSTTKQEETQTQSYSMATT